MRRGKRFLTLMLALFLILGLFAARASAVDAQIYDSMDQVIGYNPVTFDSAADLCGQHRESGLGDLIADSYLFAANQLEGEVPATLALTATADIQASIERGEVTLSDVFHVFSADSDADSLTGCPLVAVYLTGSEIKTLCEVDASVAPLMPEAQLHISGVNFTWNNNRMIFNKVSSCLLQLADGTVEEPERDGLYRVVTSLSFVQMLPAVKDRSFGLLSIVPKYADGTPAADFDDCILRDQNGDEISGWSALAAYIQSFPNGEIPDSYENSACVNRKIQIDSWSPAALLKGANRLTFGALCLVIVFILLFALLLRWIIRRIVYGKRYGKSAGTYTAQHKNFKVFHPSKRRLSYSGTSPIPRHNRPVATSRRYGNGYRPVQPKTRRRHVSKRKYGKFTYHGHESVSSGSENGNAGHFSAELPDLSRETER